MFGLLLCLPISLVVFRGMWLDAAQMTAGILVVYGVLCFMVSGSRINVTADSIECQSRLGFKQVACFRDIKVSKPQVLAEPDHPVALDIYADSGKRTEEGEIILRRLLSIRLKIYRQADVAWLLSLPDLKVER